ncbi:hypothetical protein BJF90_45300 [Pseudonocardia sp. CNS-004]|nr:hypothetical protein BJF90_45300 [Pseudonocardia sp. CNS-004]
MSWAAVLSLGVGTYLLRLVGIVLRDRMTVPERVERYLDLGATALLVALVATAALTEGGGFAGWAGPRAFWSAPWRPGGACRSCWSWCSPPPRPRACGCWACREGYRGATS